MLTSLQNSDPEVDAVLATCSRSIKAHCQVFHKERFRRPFSYNHDKLFEVVDDPTVKRIMVIAHRGFGKTSIFNYAIPSQAIIHRKYRFVVPCGATSTHAVQQSENLKWSLTTSKLARSIIGDIKTDDFSKEEWSLPWDMKIMPRGAGQQVRGLNYHDYRPDLIIPDDLENSEACRSKEQRDKLKDWFYTDLTQAVDLSMHNRIIIVGTILHEDSLLCELAEDSDWTVLNLPLTDKAGKSYWSAYLSDAECAALKAGFERKGRLHLYYREYMNDPTPDEDAVFRPEMFIKYNEADERLSHDPDVDNFVILDPAKSSRSHSAYTAIVGVAVNTRKGCIYIRDIINRRMPPDQVYKELFSMADRINAKVIGYESNGLAEFIKQPLTDAMTVRGTMYELVELKARRAQDYETEGRTAWEKGKEARVAQLAPYYRMGQILHNNTGVCDVLEAQLKAFPRSKFWDVMDATAYILEMTNIGERFFEETLPADEEAALDAEERDIDSMDDLDDRAARALDRYYDQLFAEDEEALDGLEMI